MNALLRPFVLFAGLLLSWQTHALTVLYSATDLPDSPAGDLWSYVYTLADPVPVDHSVRISFDAAVYAPVGIDAEPEGWFTDLDPGQTLPFPADGHVLFSPFTAAAATPAVFTVQVVRRVPGPVEAQSFEVFDENFDPVGSGTTTLAAVPEPETWLLLPAGAALLLLRGRRRHVGSD